MSTWTAGQEVLASQLEVAYAAWTTYTPTWTATAAPVIGNGALSGKYIAIGKTIHFTINIVGGTTTTWGGAGSQWALGLPVAANYPGVSPFNQLRPLGTYWFFDSSSGNQYSWGPVLLGTAGSTVIMPTRWQTGGGSLAAPAGGTLTTMNNGSPVTQATGDSLQIEGTYEAA